MIQQIQVQQTRRPQVRQSAGTRARQTEKAGGFGSILSAKSKERAEQTDPAEDEKTERPPEKQQKDTEDRPAAAMLSQLAAQPAAPAMPAAPEGAEALPALSAAKLTAVRVLPLAAKPGAGAEIPSAAPSAGAEPAAGQAARPLPLTVETLPAEQSAQQVPRQAGDLDTLPQAAEEPRQNPEDVRAGETPSVRSGVRASGQTAARAGSLPAGQAARARAPEEPGDAEVRVQAAPARNTPESGAPRAETGPSAALSEAEKGKNTPAQPGGSALRPAEQPARAYESAAAAVKPAEEAPAGAAAAPRQVAQAAAGALKAGRKEFSMDLYPRSLGKVSVKMSAEDGLLTVEISASDPKTQSLLLSSADEIQAILRQDAGRAAAAKPADPPWNEQARQNARQGGQDRRRQDTEQRRRRFAGDAALNPAGVGTGDFLSLLRLAGT